MNIDLKEKLFDPKRRICIDSKYAINHVGRKRWDIISKNIGNDIDLWRNLYDIGKKNLAFDNSYNSKKNYMYCGDENYLGIRPDLISKGIVLNDLINKSNIKNKISPTVGYKKPPIKKADKIKQENTLKKFKLEIDALLKTVSIDHSTTQQTIIFNAKFVELVLVRMMIHCKNKIIKLETLNKQIDTKASSKNKISDVEKLVQEQQKELAELIVGYNKIINEKQSNLSISQTCIFDLIKWIEHAKQLIKFNATEVIISMPELIFKTVYDGMLEEKYTGLYQSQKDIFEFVTQNNKYLALVHTMLGSGKTSMILPMCGWLTHNNKPAGMTKLIFCCPNEVVLLEVAHMVYGMGASFAIVIRNQKENKLEYKWSSFADKNNPKDSAILYLCDIFVARILLEERMQIISRKKMYIQTNHIDLSKKPLAEQRIPIVPDYILIGDELPKYL